ncbi:hypothetical protein QWM81_04925 [Streptomyces ficellus]|uniref:Uncharacterized protein n=1 Tax=Streptomyces ficellus TaxID=1977088 RepID=A0ABT7Z1N2_9ACTN|nr:hypothetical protein [Streptomyces ficellus]MDN3293394.1 hypothetical protein [Streptomyces ficellus]
MAVAVLELALAFHRAVLGEYDKVRTVIDRLRELPWTGDYVYYADIAHSMADLPMESSSSTRWIDGTQAVRRRWRALVTARRAYLRTAR